MDLSRKAAMFYGCEHSDLKPTNGEFAFVGSLGGLYRLLLRCWRRETCAPRLQEKWSASNPTCGQCSITSFLVQDIFGGEVYGVPNGDGSFHCFNKGSQRIGQDTRRTPTDGRTCQGDKKKGAGDQWRSGRHLCRLIRNRLKLSA